MSKIPKVYVAAQRRAGEIILEIQEANQISFSDLCFAMQILYGVQGFTNARIKTTIKVRGIAKISEFICILEAIKWIQKNRNMEVKGIDIIEIFKSIAAVVENERLGVEDANKSLINNSPILPNRCCQCGQEFSSEKPTVNPNC